MLHSIITHDEDAALGIPPAPYCALISIQGRFSLAGWQHAIRLDFDDQEPRSNVPAGRYKLFNDTHATAIFDFIDGLPKRVYEIHIHCAAGQSRSPAVALGIYMYRRLGMLRFTHSHIFPNRHVLTVMSRVAAARKVHS